WDAVGGCPASWTTVDTVPSASETFTQITDIDLSGSRAVWTRQTQSGSHVHTRDLAIPGPIARVDDVGANAAAVGARVDGQRFAWAQSGEHDESDIFWRDV